MIITDRTLARMREVLAELRAELEAAEAVPEGMPGRGERIRVAREAAANAQAYVARLEHGTVLTIR